MPEEIIRLYSMQDEELQTRAQSQKSFLQADLAQFTPLFPWITGAYLTSYQSDIDTAVAFPLDNTVMTDIKVLTSDVNASVTEGKAALDLLFKYSEIAYPGDKVRQRVFGQDMMERARQDQEKWRTCWIMPTLLPIRHPTKLTCLPKDTHRCRWMRLPP